MRAGMRPRGAAVGPRHFGCHSPLHLSSPLQNWRIQAAAPGRVASKPRSRRPIAETPRSKSATSVQAAMRIPLGICCTLPSHLEGRRLRASPVQGAVLTSHKNLRTSPKPLTTPSPPRRLVPNPPDSAPADLAPSSSRRQNASVNRLRDHSGRLEPPETSPGAFKVASPHAANSATTLSGALDPLDKTCGHLLRRLEADHRPKGLAGPPDPRGPGLRTPRNYTEISLAKKLKQMGDVNFRDVRLCT